LSIAYGLGLPSFDVLLKDESRSITLERDVTGTWTGGGRELEFPKENAEFSAEFVLTMSDRGSILSDCVLTRGTGRNKERIAFKMMGELCFGQIVKLDYVSVEQRDMRFGTVMLKLNGPGNQMRGYALGYSAVLEKPTVADVWLERK